jgi:hypothetical protein
MKKIFLSLMILFVALALNAQQYTYVSGYTKSNGTYVEGHYRTLPNSTRDDNWSTIGNVNPFTGIAGTKPGDSYYSNSYNYSTTSYPTTSYSSYNYITPSYSYPTYSGYSTPITYSSNGYGSIYSLPIYISCYSTYSYYR